MKMCPPCQFTVPAVSAQIARELVDGLDPSTKANALVLALCWLTESHPGLTVYHGIVGRPYADDERREIALDEGVVSDLTCPFMDTDAPDACLIGGLGPNYTSEGEAARAPYGWLPMMLCRALDRHTLVELVKHRYVADAKVATLARNRIFPERGAPSADDLVNKKAGYDGLPPGTDLVNMELASGKAT